MMEITSGNLATSKLYYIHSDHLGIPKAVTDVSGVKVWGGTHDPFGNATVSPASSVELNLRFPGQYFDLETGLYYNLHRYYDPNIGRYITSDPIGLEAGVNTYAYVENNPLNWIDPDGLMSGRPPVLPRIPNIPRNWPVKPTKKGGGEQYINPKNPHERIRVMPGNPKSPNPAQQNPYVKYQKDGQCFDKNGKPVDPNSPEAHIPLGDFKWPASMPPVSPNPDPSPEPTPYPWLPADHPFNQRA